MREVIDSSAVGAVASSVRFQGKATIRKQMKEREFDEIKFVNFQGA